MTMMMMMPRRGNANYVFVRGELDTVSARPAGGRAAMIFEVRLRLARPRRATPSLQGRSPEDRPLMLVPALTWDQALGSALAALLPGTALVVIEH